LLSTAMPVTVGGGIPPSSRGRVFCWSFEAGLGE
jgi:hypothetical protein